MPPPLRIAAFHREQLGRTNGTSTKLADTRTFVFNPNALLLDVRRGTSNPPRVPAAVIVIDRDLYVIAEGSLDPQNYDNVRPEVVELFR